MHSGDPGHLEVRNIQGLKSTVASKAANTGGKSGHVFTVQLRHFTSYNMQTSISLQQPVIHILNTQNKDRSTFAQLSLFTSCSGFYISPVYLTNVVVIHDHVKNITRSCGISQI